MSERVRAVFLGLGIALLGALVATAIIFRVL